MVKWKRERENRIVKDYKYDFVDVHEFEKHECGSKIRYSWVFFIVLKAVLVYIADLYSMTALLLNDNWATIKPPIPFAITKWIFVGSILISFILLFLEMKKAYAIVHSRDISFSFTNMIAYRYYTLTSYAHWCFFMEIQNRENWKDKIAFYVFFAFKGYKRLLLCDGPRQIINALTVFTILHDKKFSMNIAVYGSITTRTSIAIMSFTVIVFIFSAINLLGSFLLYLPLLCHIRGNLKEYCCHIIDKRIGQLLDNQRKERIDANKKDQSKGLQPTIPTLEDDYILPQYNEPPSKAFNISDVPPDQIIYNVAAEKQGYFVQQRDSISSNPIRESSPAPLFHNYDTTRRESNSSVSGQIYNERANSPGFNPRQYSSPTPPPFIRQVNQPPYMQQSSQPIYQQSSQPIYQQSSQPIYQQSSQPIYQQRSPRMLNVAGPQNSISSPIVRPRQDMNNPQQPPLDSYYQGVSAPIPNISGQYNYDPSNDYYGNQMSQRPMMAYGQGQEHFSGESNEIQSNNNVYNPQDQMNARRYDNYNQNI